MARMMTATIPTMIPMISVDPRPLLDFAGTLSDFDVVVVGRVGGGKVRTVVKDKY